MAREAAAPSTRRSIGQTLAPGRFIALVVVSTVVAAGLSRLYAPLVAWILGFDVGSAVFLVSLVPLMRGSGPEAMREHARENDANRKTVLACTVLAASAVFCALALAVSSETTTGVFQRAATLATLLLVWLLVNAVYMLHYAHLFYTAGQGGDDMGGIELPGKSCTPDYFDFAYFALTIGMTFQTSDIQVTSPQIRRIATLHAFASFVFNLGVLAFAINVIGGSSH